MQASVKTDREKYIGGSDIPVILNISPFKKRFDLLLEKAGFKADTFAGTVYTEYGNTMEPKIRDYINNTFPEDDFIEDKHIREAKEGEPIGVRIHTDGENRFAILEVKTTSEIHENVNEYKLYLVQLLFYMVYTNKPIGVLAVYERPEDLSEEFDPTRLQLFTINKEDYTELIAEIGEAVERFIEDLKKVKANPFITEAELLPNSNKLTDITNRILAFEAQIEQLKQIEKKITAERKKLKEAMIEAKVKTWVTPGGYRVTLVPDGEDKLETIEELDLVALERDLPELFKDASEGGYMTYRQEKKKGKKGYVLITAPKKEG